MSQPVNVQTLLSAVITTGAGTAVENTASGTFKSFQATGVLNASTGAAVISVDVSNVASPTANDWISAGTISLTLSTTSATDGFGLNVPWRWIRGNVTSLTAATSTISLYMGEK